MWLFDKIEQIKQYFSNRKNNIKALPESQEQKNYNQVKEYELKRDDGTIVTITPILDRIGNQGYQSIFNRETGKMEAIPMFQVSTDEIKNLTRSEMAKQTMLIDIQPQILENAEYAHYIANELLSDNRVGKIMGQYKNYAGGIYKQSNGEIRRYIKKGIIDTLTATKEENAIALEMAQERKIRQAAYEKEVNYKTSHATNLSERN